MTDATSSAEAGASLFLTYDSFVDEVEAVLSQARRLEEASSPGEQAVASGLDQTIRTLISRGRRTGTILDSFKERRDFQRELDYLAKLLERFHTAPEEVSLEPFEPTSLATIPAPAFPFDDIRQQRDKTPTPTREDIQAYLLKTAGAASLRFDDGLVEEIAVQLSGDPEAWPLLWCCLWNLHSRLSEERLGNKLRRPKGSTSFDCRSFAADVAKRAYLECPPDQKSYLKRVLVEFGLSRGDNRAQPAVFSMRGLRWRARVHASSVIARLNDFRLVWQVGEQSGESSYCLVHRALLERWDELQAWVEGERSRRRQTKQLAGIILLLIALGLGVVGYIQKRAATEANSREMAYRSLDLLSLDSTLALATAIEAVCIGETPPAWESIARALDGRPEKHWFYPPDADRQQLVVAGYAGDGVRVVTADAEGNTKVWDPLSGREALELQEKYSGIRVTAFGGERQVALARRGQDGAWSVRTVNLDTGQATSDAIIDIPRDHAISALALSSDGTHLAIGTTTGSVQIYGPGKPVSKALNLRRAVKALAFNANATLLVAANEQDEVTKEQKVIVWRVQTGESLGEIRVDPDERILAVGFERSDDHVLTINEVSDVDGPGIKVRLGLKGYTSEKLKIDYPVEDATLDSRGTQILLVHLDGTVRVLDRVSMRETLVVRSSATTSGFTGVFSPNGAELAITNNDSTIRLWDVKKPVFHLPREDAIRSAASADGDKWAVGTLHGEVYVLDTDPHTPSLLPREEPNGQAPQPTKSIRVVSYSARGEKVAAAYQDGLVRVWNAKNKNKELVSTIDASGRKRPGSATCLSFSPDANRLVTTSAEGYVALWEGKATTPVSSMTKPSGDPHRPLCAAFRDDGKLIIVGSDGRVGAGAGLSDQKPIRTGSPEGGGIKLLKSAAISPDGKKIAGVADDGGDVMLFDVDAKKGWRPLPGGRRLANFTADSSRVATMDWDSGVSVWDTRSLRRVARFGAHQTAALSRDGRKVLMARGKLWSIEKCWACGPIAEKRFQDELKADARKASQGFAGDERFGQFTCFKSSSVWSLPQRNAPK